LFELSRPTRSWVRPAADALDRKRADAHEQ
jgi:hypothetical protein